ncbi:MAG: HEAT repeat domain-containing protein [Gemmatimonadota bacterium]
MNETPFRRARTHLALPVLLVSMVATAPPSTAAAVDGSGSGRPAVASSASLLFAGGERRALQQTSPEIMVLYRQAREALNVGNYRRAAALFRVAGEGALDARLAADAAYYEAFALYRLGGVDNYRRGLAVLEQQRVGAAAPGRDTEELYVRIRSALAMAGDPGAVAAINRAAAAGETTGAGPATITIAGRPVALSDALGGFPGGAPLCSPAEHPVRIAELNALRRLHDELALPVLRGVLTMRDECSAPLRRQAVFLTAQTEAAGVGPLLVDVARYDPDPTVRAEAVFWLSSVDDPAVATALAELLRDAIEPSVRERAAFALARHDSPVARSALRGVVLDASADESIRLRAVGWLAADVPARDPAFLAEAYPDIDNPRLRGRVIDAIGLAGDPWAAGWLRERALDVSEHADLRKSALFRYGRVGTDTRDLVEVFGALETSELREHGVFVIGQRPGWEASRALLDIAREARTPELRDMAIFWLNQRQDPTAREALAELLGRR